MVHLCLHEFLIGGTCGVGGFVSGMWFRTRQLARRSQREAGHGH